MRYFEEDGIELSTGQWQKLSVARAFYSDSDILILDEPTAALDAIAEQEIYSQFDSLRKDKTTIFVSHRLSSATTADKILVLEDGQIIESGTHRELMRKGGRYCELFSTQAQRYIASESDIKNNRKNRRKPKAFSDFCFYSLSPPFFGFVNAPKSTTARIITAVTINIPAIPFAIIGRVLRNASKFIFIILHHLNRAMSAEVRRL